MFGIFMVILILGVYLVKDVKSCTNLHEKRRQAIEKGESFYVDNQGNFVDIKSNITYNYRWIDGDCWVVNMATNTPMRNLSKIKREKFWEENKKKAIEEGDTAYLYEEREPIGRHDKVEGNRYKDMKTEAIYVVRSCNTAEALMDIETGKFVRLFNYEKEKDNYFLQDCVTEEECVAKIEKTLEHWREYDPWLNQRRPICR